MTILVSHDETNNKKTVLYDEILSVSLNPQTKSFNLQHRWSFIFNLETKSRLFTLYASSEDE